MSSNAKAKVAELFAYIQSPNRDGADKIYHTNCSLCIAKPFGQTERRTGTHELIALNEAYHRAFPKFRIEVETLLEDGDRVAAQWRLIAEPSRELIEPLTQIRVKSAAEQIRVEGIAFYRLRDSRVLESFMLQDELGTLMQLGVDPGGLPVVDFQPDAVVPERRSGNGSDSSRKQFIGDFMREVVNEKDESRREAAAARYVAQDMRLLGPDAGNVDSRFTGIEKFTAGHRKYRKAFPDFEFVTLDMVEEGNRIALRWSVDNAWHTGPLQVGEYELQPTGNNANVHGAAVCEVVDGKIVSIWQLTDSASLLRQLMS